MLLRVVAWYSFWDNASCLLDNWLLLSDYWFKLFDCIRYKLQDHQLMYQSVISQSSIKSNLKNIPSKKRKTSQFHLKISQIIFLVSSIDNWWSKSLFVSSSYLLPLVASLCAQCFVLNVWLYCWCLFYFMAEAFICRMKPYLIGLEGNYDFCKFMLKGSAVVLGLKLLSLLFEWFMRTCFRFLVLNLFEVRFSYISLFLI